MKKQRKPFFAIILIILMIFQSISALFGGIELILDPSGNLLQMPVTSLAQSPFPDFLVPGLILFLILGIFPGFTAACLIFRPRLKWADILNIYKGRHFAWTYSIYTGIMLIIWITVQIQMVGFGHSIQTIYASLGILILISTLSPPVMEYYKKEVKAEVKTWRTL